MVGGSTNCLPIFGLKFVNILHPHIHQGVHFRPDNTSGFFVQGGNLVSGLDVFDLNFVVEIVAVRESLELRAWSLVRGTWSVIV